MKVTFSPGRPGQTEAVIHVETGDRVALVDESGRVVAPAQTATVPGELRWERAERCSQVWWAVLDERGEPYAWFYITEWRDGDGITVDFPAAPAAGCRLLRSGTESGRGRPGPTRAR